MDPVQAPATAERLSVPPELTGIACSGRTLIELVSAGTTVTTQGLPLVTDQRELSVDAVEPRLVPDAAALIRSVVLYIARTGRKIAPGETFQRGFWHVRFDDGAGELHAAEPDPRSLDYRNGAAFALSAWRGQHETCDLHGSAFRPPRPDQLVVVSPGVLDSDRPTQGVRYPSPEHMSGWWVSTDLYDGDIDMMKPVHAHHVAAARPELVRLLALEYGWRWNAEVDPMQIRWDADAARGDE